ncbi:hypothetical protein WICPIJ_003393 [Wickerhamomyces pijperi]|uniref:Uncharacterized protein n=1 Tax=Wickerhamomyces pijperi TaxID=599730 RepID=A0A9P8Q813_WICPI|nr:hypothetical protein WICPIJ_003393 [Wickerhamomyces pijperi]
MLVVQGGNSSIGSFGVDKLNNSFNCFTFSSLDPSSGDCANSTEKLFQVVVRCSCGQVLDVNSVAWLFTWLEPIHKVVHVDVFVSCLGWDICRGGRNLLAWGGVVSPFSDVDCTVVDDGLVELFNGRNNAFVVSERDNTVPSGVPSVVQLDIGVRHITDLLEDVFESLPVDAEWKVANKDLVDWALTSWWASFVSSWWVSVPVAAVKSVSTRVSEAATVISISAAVPAVTLVSVSWRTIESGSLSWWRVILSDKDFTAHQIGVVELGNGVVDFFFGGELDSTHTSVSTILGDNIGTDNVTNTSEMVL